MMNRLRAISRAGAIRFNLHRRHIRDQGSGSASPRHDALSASDSRLSRREIMRALIGVLAGLLIIALVWILTARTAQQSLPPVSEMSRPAPDFALPGLDGTTVRLSDYRGKVVLVNFWGTWCEPCKEETPALAAVYKKLHDQRLVIIGVDLRNQERSGADGDADVRAFVTRYGANYPIALDTAGETARAFQIYPIPTSYFVDAHGVMRYVRVGTLSQDEVESLFARLQREATTQS
jgi:cytochrome c biogenesis protein CcmG/thiol:disulfide interchange protein DsbE